MLGKVIQVILTLSISASILLAVVEGGKKASSWWSDAREKPATELSIETPATAHDLQNTGDESPGANVDVVIDQLPAVEVYAGEARVEEKLNYASTSHVLIEGGVISTTWKNNSWGITSTPGVHFGTSSIDAIFSTPWAGFSLYSSGLFLKDLRSVALVYAPLTQSTSTLYLAFYQSRTRIGAIPLVPELSPDGRLTARVSLNDMELLSHLVTDVIIESEFPTALAIFSIKFSEAIVPSVRPSEVAVTATPDEVQISVPPPTPLPPLAEPGVYFAGLQNGWRVSARRATLDVENTERSVTGMSMKVSFESLTSAVTIYHPLGFDTKKFSSVTFMVNGGVTDYLWQQLYVTAYDMEGRKLGTVDIAGYTGRGRLVNQQWDKFMIPLEALGATGSVIGSIDIENASITQPGDAIWIDGIAFESY